MPLPPYYSGPTPATLPRPLLSFPPGKETILPRQLATLPGGQQFPNNNLASNSNSNTINNSGNSINPVNQVSNQTISQGSSHNQTLAIAHLPPGEGSSSPPVAVQLHSEANSSSPQANNQTISQGSSHNQTPAIAHLPPGKEAVLPQ